MRRIVSRYLLSIAVCSQMVATATIATATVATATAATVPQGARALMPNGAISLRWQEVKTNTADGPVWMHLYCLPKGYSAQLADRGIKRSGPVKREYITNGPSLVLSPFRLDIFRRNGPTWRRLNSVKFEQDQDVNETVIRWMEPKQRRGPILLLHFGFSHWHEWEVFTFPRGWGQAAYHQTFLWGGEGEYFDTQRFDRTDKNGRLFIEEQSGTPEGTGTHRYNWNGREWEDATERYFVIGATSRSKAVAEAEEARRGFGEVLFSTHYPRLRPGYYIWVAGRHRSMTEANEQLKGLQSEKIKTYIRRVR